MNAFIDPEKWPSIRFEGEWMPQSLAGISILMDREFTQQTGDWIWRLPHCHECWKEGEAAWCIASATEIIDYLLEHRDAVAAEIRERLGPFGFEGDSTLNEWLAALVRIQDLARSSGGTCRWIAGEPTGRAEETRRGLSAFLDQQGSAEQG